MSNLLLRAYSPVPVSGEKTSCQNGIGTKGTRNIGIDLRSVNDPWQHQWPRTRKTGKLMWSVPPGPLQAAAQLALCLARLTLHAMPAFGSTLFGDPVTTSVHFWITSSFSSSNSVQFFHVLNFFVSPGHTEAVWPYLEVLCMCFHTSTSAAFWSISDRILWWKKKSQIK